MIVGVVGAGQLGRMLALAGLPLGLRFRFLDPNNDACARRVGDLVTSPFDDAQALARFGEGLDVATYEFENASADSVRALAERVPVRPGAESLRVTQDRVLEKQFFEDADLPVAPWAPVESLDDLISAIDTVGAPGVLKTRTGGYDGKGQARIGRTEDARAAWAAIGERPAIYERFVEFDREVSLIFVRSAHGETAAYPLVENTHIGGILARTDAPAPRVTEAMQRDAETRVSALAARLDHIGVLTVEFFEAGGRLIANEMAPRVHNSGHWTIEGAETSQFENHLRAILGWPLGATNCRGPSRMLNCIGDTPAPDAVCAISAAHLHRYEKAARPGRKVGHITLTGADEAALDSAQHAVAAAIGPACCPALQT
ncbi:MAG: 5-(carboxyamino)imidazole ribonucleotide synthase [Phycisphaerales bacterium]